VDKKKLVMYVIGFLTIIVLVIAGYVTVLSKNEDSGTNLGTSSETEDRVEESNIGTANPASVFCEENGGTLEIEDLEDGEVGYCVFTDGSRCEEWTFFNSECMPGDSIDEISE
jgi:putative hemolysin